MPYKKSPVELKSIVGKLITENIYLFAEYHASKSTKCMHCKQMSESVKCPKVKAINTELSELPQGAFEILTEKMDLTVNNAHELNKNIKFVIFASLESKFFSIRCCYIDNKESGLELLTTFGRYVRKLSSTDILEAEAWDMEVVVYNDIIERTLSLVTNVTEIDMMFCVSTDEVLTSIGKYCVCLEKLTICYDTNLTPYGFLSLCYDTSKFEDTKCCKTLRYFWIWIAPELFTSALYPKELLEDHKMAMMKIYKIILDHIPNLNFLASDFCTTDFLYMMKNQKIPLPVTSLRSVDINYFDENTMSLLTTVLPDVRSVSIKSKPEPNLLINLNKLTTILELEVCCYGDYFLRKASKLNWANLKALHFLSEYCFVGTFDLNLLMESCPNLKDLGMGSPLNVKWDGKSYFQTVERIVVLFVTSQNYSWLGAFKNSLRSLFVEGCSGENDISEFPKNCLFPNAEELMFPIVRFSKESIEAVLSQCPKLRAFGFFSFEKQSEVFDWTMNLIEKNNYQLKILLC